jgi:hypothetical protein
LGAKALRFKQVTKSLDCRLIGQAGNAGIELGKLSVQRYMVQGLIHRRAGQAEPLLKNADRHRI